MCRPVPHVMTVRQRTQIHQRQPELEQDFLRSPSLGYEAADGVGFIRCLGHGFPTPLTRWHYHDEYELHLIPDTSGKAFVGDWIGPYEPGHLVLTGPRLPHTWIEAATVPSSAPDRHLVIQFLHGPIAHACEQMPELSEVMPVLERARNGIEFFGLSDRALEHWKRVRAAQGLERFAAFFAYLVDLSRCTDYRLLSNVQLQCDADDRSLGPINEIINEISADVSQPYALAELAQRCGMSESGFSRLFRRATGNTFVDFVNRLRITRACQLLMDTDRLITAICYEVGFNNVANFNRRFLEIKGVTPSEYRREAESRFRVRQQA